MSPVPLAQPRGSVARDPRHIGPQVPHAEVQAMRGLIFGLLCSLALWGLAAALLMVAL